MIAEELTKSLRTIDDLEMKLPSVINDEKLDRMEREYAKKLEKVMTDILNVQKNFEIIAANLKNAKNLINKIENTENSFVDLISNYYQVKKLSTTFFNMRKTQMYAEKISTKELTGDIIKWDEFRWKLVYYSADLSEEKYIMVQPLINMIEKKYLEWEIQILNVAENFFTMDDYFEEYFTRNNVLKMVINEEQKDIDAQRARRGRDGGDSVKEKEYFMLNGLKFTIDTDIISGNNTAITSLEYDRAFYKANKLLCARPSRKLKFRFLKTIFNAILQRNIFNAIGDYKILFKSQVFDINSSNSIFQFYHEYIKSKIDLPQLEAGDILSLLSFKRNYDALLHAHKITFSDDIFDEELFISHYLSILRDKIMLWINNITSLEIEVLRGRNKPPPLDESSNFVSTNFINLLKIIKEQLEPVAFDERIFKGISNYILHGVVDFREAIVTTLENEYRNAISLTSTPGYEEYVIMVGNSGLKLTQYISNLPQCKNVEINDLGEIFISIVRSSNQLLIKFIITTIKPAIKELFTENYYKNRNLTQIVATLKDFLDDYRECMNEYVFSIFISDLASELSNVYFGQLIKKKSLIYQNLCECIEQDERTLSRFFALYTNDDVISLSIINPLLTTRSVDMFIVETKKILFEHEFKKDFVKSLIKKRSDLETDEKKELTDAVNSVYLADSGNKSKRGVFKIFTIK